MYEKRLQRLPAARGAAPPQPASSPAEQGKSDRPTGRVRWRRRFGRAGGFGQQDYSSPVIADGKLYFVRRGGDVSRAGRRPRVQALGVNKFEGRRRLHAPARGERRANLHPLEQQALLPRDGRRSAHLAPGH